MKKRLGFVTNSSSSSFICEVCGEIESGWDMCLSEAGMYECENYHTFCISEAIDADIDYAKKAEKLIAEDESNFRWYGDASMSKEDYIEYLKEDKDAAKEFVLECSDGQVPAECCPICTREHIRENELIDFALSKLGIERKELEELTRAFLLEEDKKKQNK